MVKVNELVGKRFVNGGRDVKNGLDCWGLVMEVFKHFGVTVPDFSVNAFAFQAIDALAKKATGLSSWKEVYRPIDTDAPLVVLMRMHPKLITHAGVFIGNNRIIHTTKATGVITTRADALKSRIVGYYKYAKDN